MKMEMLKSNMKHFQLLFSHFFIRAAIVFHKTNLTIIVPHKIL